MGNPQKVQGDDIIEIKKNLQMLEQSGNNMQGNGKYIIHKDP